MSGCAISRTITALSILTFCFSVPVSAYADDTSAEVIAVLMRDGEDALAGERYAEAYARFEEVLKLDWNNPRAYDLLQQARYERDHALLRWEGEAKEAEGKRDLSRAKWIYERILGEDSTRGDLRERVRRLANQREAATFVRTGMEKFMMDDFAGAQLDFEQALAVNPKDTLALQYRERTRQKIAATGSLASIQADSESWARYLDALRKLREGDLIGAEMLWSELLVKYPGNESILSNLSQVKRRLGSGGAIANDE